MGAETQEDCAATCKSIQKKCLAKGGGLLTLLNGTISESFVELHLCLTLHESVSGNISLSSYTQKHEALFLGGEVVCTIFWSESV